MKAADAAGLVASRTGHVVEPPLKARGRADVLQRHAAFGRLLQGYKDVTLREDRIRRSVLALHQAKSRLEARGRKSDGRRRDGGSGKKFFGDQDSAVVEPGKMLGIEQPSLELASQCRVGQNPVAIDLVLERRLLKPSGLRVVIEDFQEIVGAKIADSRFRRMRDLQIGFDAGYVLRPDQIQR